MLYRNLTRSQGRLGGAKILLWVCCLSLSLLLASPMGQSYRPGELVVSLGRGGDITILSLLYGLVPLEQLDGTGIWRVRALGILSTTLELLLRDAGVEFAELNYLMSSPEAEQQSMAFLDQDRPPYISGESPSQYYTQPAYVRMQLELAHEVTTGPGTVVAVVDTGISFDHPALAGRVSPGYDFVDRDDDPADEPGGVSYGHGTFVSGIIALVAPKAKILPLRALSPCGSGDIFTVARAIRYGVYPGRADVINLSLGLPRRALVVENALRYAAAAGVVVVASAGNRNSRIPQYPASGPHVIGVAAVDSDDIKADFSNFNEWLSASAPGVDVYSTFPGGLFATWSGTSFAAPFVAGEAALIRSLYPQASPADVRDLIQQSADNIDALNPTYAGRLGAGRINCQAATQ